MEPGQAPLSSQVLNHLASITSSWMRVALFQLSLALLILLFVPLKLKDIYHELAVWCALLSPQLALQCVVYPAKSDAEVSEVILERATTVAACCVAMVEAAGLQGGWSTNIV